MLKKIILGMVAVFFIFLGIFILSVGYFFTHPDKFMGAMTTATKSFFQGEPYEESGEFYLEGISALYLNARSIKHHVSTYDGATLKISLSGKIPRFTQGPFIFQNINKDQLRIDLQDAISNSWFQMNVNGEVLVQKSDVELEAHIYIPRTFKKQINIHTIDGPVELHLPVDALYELDLHSTSGKIQNQIEPKNITGIQPENVGKISISTELGSISVQSE